MRRSWRGVENGAAMQTAHKAGDKLLLDLRDAIRNGTLRAGARLAPVRELAEKYGVTASKAQRVIQRLAGEGLVTSRRGDGSYVSEAAVASEGTGVRSTPAAGPTVGIVLSRFSFEMIVRPMIEDASGGAEFMRGVEEVLGASHGAYELIPPTGEDLQQAIEKPELRTLMMLSCTDSDSTSSRLEAFRRRGGQVILVEDYPGNLDWALRIRVDAAAGIRKAVAHLHQLGHRAIAHLTWEQDQAIGSDWLDVRRHTYEDALEDAGESPFVIEVLGLDAEPHALPDVTEKLSPIFKGTRRPTAIVCANDILAERLSIFAARSGIKIPEQLSITGFDDAPVAIGLALTTVGRHFREMGRMASSFAQQHHSGATACEGEIRIDPKLVVRRSTCPAGR